MELVSPAVNYCSGNCVEEVGETGTAGTGALLTMDFMNGSLTLNLSRLRGGLHDVVDVLLRWLLNMFDYVVLLYNTNSKSFD